MLTLLNVLFNSVGEMCGVHGKLTFQFTWKRQIEFLIGAFKSFRYKYFWAGAPFQLNAHEVVLGSIKLDTHVFLKSHFSIICPLFYLMIFTQKFADCVHKEKMHLSMWPDTSCSTKTVNEFVETWKGSYHPSSNWLKYGFKITAKKHLRCCSCLRIIQ